MFVVVVVVVESVNIGTDEARVVGTWEVTGVGHGVMVIRVEMVAVGEGMETVSTKSLKIGNETGISTVTSGAVEIGCKTSG